MSYKGVSFSLSWKPSIIYKKDVKKHVRIFQSFVRCCLHNYPQYHTHFSGLPNLQIQFLFQHKHGQNPIQDFLPSWQYVQFAQFSATVKGIILKMLPFYNSGKCISGDFLVHIISAILFVMKLVVFIKHYLQPMQPLFSRDRKFCFSITWFGQE